MDLAELVAPMEKLAEQGLPNMETPDTGVAEQAISESKVTIDRRDGVQSINGVPCRRTVAVVESPTQMTAVDPETGETITIDRKSFMVLDQWHSTELAGYNTIRGFERRMAEVLMGELDRESLSEFAEAMKNRAPGVQDAMMRAYEGLGDIEGMVVKESVHFIPAPPDATLDLEAILANSPTGPSSDNADGLRPMYTFMTEIGDLTTEPIDMSVFGPPTEGYAQVESPMKQAMEMMNSGPLNAGQPVSDERDDDR